MIKFFKTMRKTNLKEGKTANYLKYAIGEIILVMIGILLALQVNNWNEVRKQRIEEIGLLKNMSTDFDIKNKQLHEAYAFNKKTHDVSTRFIMSELNHQKDTFAIEDVLKFGDYIPVSTHVNSLEVALEGNTINIFRSDSLVNMLRQLKANFVNLAIDEAYMDELWTSNFVPYFQKYGLSIYRFALIQKGIVPDTEILKGIDMYDLANRTSDIVSVEFEWLKKQEIILDNMNTIIEMIQKELER
jgi:Family of unknown function (DUF6090)